MFHRCKIFEILCVQMFKTQYFYYGFQHQFGLHGVFLKFKLESL